MSTFGDAAAGVVRPIGQKEFERGVKQRERRFVTALRKAVHCRTMAGKSASSGRHKQFHWKQIVGGTNTKGHVRKKN